MSKFFEKDRLRLSTIRSQLKAEFGGYERIAPAIIPPMLGKMTIARAIRDQWKAGIECLKRARYLAIIGYSFPPSDLFMIRLLTEGLRDNGNLERIWIVDFQKNPKDRRAWEDRISKLFRRTAFSDYKIALCADGTEKFMERLLRGGHLPN